MNTNVSIAKYIIICFLVVIILLCSNCLMASLIANYSFNEGTGTTTTDSSGNNNTGTITGAAWVPLPGGSYCLSFDGTNDFVNCGNGSSLNLSSATTMVAWVCPSGLQNTSEVGICGKANTANDSKYLLTYYNNASFLFYINSGSYNVSTTLSPNEWNQIAVTYNKLYMKIYVNGVFKSQKTLTSSIISGSNFYIGAINGGTLTGAFKGFIDDVKVYNNALSATEVANLYNISTRNNYNSMFINGVEVGQVAHYACNEGTGTSIGDSSGYLNNGTASNVNWYANPSPADGYSLDFNGTSSYVDCGTGNGLNITDTITMMAWINPSSNQSGEVGILGKGFSTYLLTYYNENCFWYINWTGGTSINIQVSPNTWSHVAATYDKENLKIYVNGLLMQTSSPYTATISSGSNFYFGRMGTSQYFNGKIDEARVYNRALSASEISSRYNEDTAARNGLVAHYKLDEAYGNIAFDASGHGNTATLAGCTWTSVNGSSALYFDGIDDLVDCGNGSSLDLSSTNRMTSVAWICPDSTQTFTEPGILGKSMSSYIWTYYKNSQIWSYINTSGNSNKIFNVLPGSWNQVVTSFDGMYIRLYLNGQLFAKGSSSYSTINSDSTHLFIGANGSSGDRFKGYVDDVKIYNRALADNEVTALFSSSDQLNRNSMFTVPCNQVAPTQSINSGNITVKAGIHGGIQINNGGSTYFVMDSSYSYPGTSVGYNKLSETSFGGETGWSPNITKPNSTTLQITASGTKYSLSRQVQLVTRNGLTCVKVEDTLTNMGSSEVGILIDHSIISPSQMTNSFAGNEASNPMIFFSQSGGDFGIIAEDDFGRLQYHPTAIANIAGIHHNSFGLDISKSYTFKYVIYPLASTGDIFDLVNQVRKDWNSNVTIPGPWRFMDMSELNIPWNNANELKRWVQRRNLNFADMSPWPEYDPGYNDHIFSRSEFQSNMATATAKLRAANPLIKCIGSIETLYIDIDPNNHTDTTHPRFPAIVSYLGGDHCWQYWGDIIKDYWTVARPGTDPAFIHNDDCGPGKLYARVIPNTANLSDAISNAILIWQDPNSPYMSFDFADSIARETPNSVGIEFYARGSSRYYSLQVYPGPGSGSGNGMYNFLMNQAAFIMDTCGLDGFYEDMFSNAWMGISVYSYGNTGELQWDGYTVNIDRNTGQIQSANGKKVDLSYIGINQRVNLMNAAVSRNKIMTANSWSTSQAEQSMPTSRFWETWQTVCPDFLTLGAEPSFDSSLFAGTLGTPIGLGALAPIDSSIDMAQGLMTCIMKYLRHGMVYYHYGYPELNTTGFGSGEYGPINHMFPMTPIELHKGWIKGQERIVSCVSFATNWTNTSAYPHVHFFDDYGREIPAQPSTRYAIITGSPGNWNISVHINNWNEFAIIEEDNTDLMAHYKFDEGSNDLAYDSSGKAGPALIQGNPNWVQVDTGYCLRFDGTSNYLDCGVSNQLNPNSTITISAWVAPYSTQNSNEQGIAGKGFASFLLSFKPIDNKANWYISSGANKTQSTIPNDLWSLVTATFDGTTLKLYANGQLVSTQASSYSQINSGSNFLIGCIDTLNGLPTNAFKGLLDEIKVYNRALSAVEIAQSFDSQELNLRNAMFINELDNGLMAYYKFDEGTGTTSIDSSGHNNTGTISGASWQSIGTNQYALSFDGVNDYIDCGNPSSLDLLKNITTIFWMNPATTQIANEPGIVGKSLESYATTYYLNSYLYSYISSNSNNTGGLVPTNTWSQIATTFDGTTMKLYKNGILLSQKASTQSLINSGNNLFIGCRGLTEGVPSECFKGFIDNVKIYNRVLSDNDIRGQYFSEYYLRNNIAPTTIASAKSLSLNSLVYLKDIPISAKTYNPDGSYYGFAVEEPDRFIGVRVITTTIIDAGNKADVYGYIYRDNGELVIDARNGIVLPTGTVTQIAPYSVATVDTGGGLKSNQGAVLDNATKTPKTASTALNTIGMLIRIRGIVTAVGSDYFYINDGYGITELLDGSGYVGMKCGKANLVSLPAIGDYVEATGVVGVKLIGGYNTRYLWTTNLSSATISTYAFYVHSGLTDFRNMISLPAQPVYPEPAVLFNGIAINNNLQTYTGGTSAKTYTTATASTFGGINYSYGFSFDSSQSNPYAFSYLGYNDPTPLDRWISVPNGVSGGSVLIGVPYNHATKWNDWHATDLTALKSVGDADTAAWLNTSGDWYSNGIVNTLIPGDSLYQNYGYKIRVNKKLAIIAPSNSTLNKLVTGGVLLEDFIGNEDFQIEQIPIVIGTDNGVKNIFRAVVPTQITPYSGNFSIDVNSGIYNMTVKASHWLRRLVSDFNVDLNTNLGIYNLINGDVIDNNEVDFSDINAVRAAYGSFPGDGNWNTMADVDGSGEVDFTDINIVRSNYGEIGD